MSHVERLALQIKAHNDCLEDLYGAYGKHIKQGDYKAAAQCAWRIQQAEFKIKRLQVQLQDNENFYWVIANLRERGLGDIADKIMQSQHANQN